MISPDKIQFYEVAACCLCGNMGYTLYRDLHDRFYGISGVWNLLHCEQCDLLWLTPRPVEEDIGKLYIKYFTHETEQQTGIFRRLREKMKDVIVEASFGPHTPIQRNCFHKIIKAFSLAGPLRNVADSSIMWLNELQKGKLLDVGCGNGAFLVQMRKLGWHVTGVDTDLEAVQIARKQSGLHVIPGTLEEANFQESSFDSITMNHVIEHAPDPIRMLEESERVLKPGGRLVIVTPNKYSLGHKLFQEMWAGLEPPRHFFLFSPHAIKSCAEKVGLHVEQTRTIARSARFFWHASKSSHSGGTLQRGFAESPSWTIRFEGILFWALEHLLVKMRPVGEEILMIARKAN